MSVPPGQLHIQDAVIPRPADAGPRDLSYSGGVIMIEHMPTTAERVGAPVSPLSLNRLISDRMGGPSSRWLLGMTARSVCEGDLERDLRAHC